MMLKFSETGYHYREDKLDRGLGIRACWDRICSDSKSLNEGSLYQNLEKKFSKFEYQGMVSKLGRGLGIQTSSDNIHSDSESPKGALEVLVSKRFEYQVLFWLDTFLVVRDYKLIYQKEQNIVSIRTHLCS